MVYMFFIQNFKIKDLFETQSPLKIPTTLNCSDSTAFKIRDRVNCHYLSRLQGEDILIFKCKLRGMKRLEHGICHEQSGLGKHHHQIIKVQTSCWQGFTWIVVHFRRLLDLLNLIHFLYIFKEVSWQGMRLEQVVSCLNYAWWKKLVWNFI